jgi:hypothetical protein
MSTLAKPTFGTAGPLSAPDVCVIDGYGPLMRGPHVHGFLDSTQGLLDRGAKTLAISLAQVPYADSYGGSSLVAIFHLACRGGAGVKCFRAARQCSQQVTARHSVGSL